MRFYYKFYIIVLFLVSFTFLFCEYFIYYLVISQCSWPELENENEKFDDKGSLIKSMILADTHLLGPFRGHWFDKLRREWQMYRSFQSAISLYEPEVVFILGDLFDEGQWCDDEEFEKYIDRFFSLFKVPSTTHLYVVPGNHDLGFHYELRPYLLYRFDQIFNISSVQFLNLKGNYFVLLNSMAMEGDDCYLCYDAEIKLKKIAGKLKCMKNGNCPKIIKNMKYSRPIVLQHFPMFRKSDAKCNETDEAPAHLKNTIFREKWDCLSREASEMVFYVTLCMTSFILNFDDYPVTELGLIKDIYKSKLLLKLDTKMSNLYLLYLTLSQYEKIYNELNPRAIFTGHVHHGCHTIHRGDIHEYTLPSFSWRNKNNPTFTLAKITPNNYSIKKCDLPRETTVILLYSSVLLGSLIWIIYKCKKKLKKI